MSASIIIQCLKISKAAEQLVPSLLERPDYFFLLSGKGGESSLAHETIIIARNKHHVTMKDHPILKVYSYVGTVPVRIACSGIHT